MNLAVPENGKSEGSLWPPFVVMIVLTPFFLLAGIGSAGSGHGSYFIAKLLFPFTMLSTTQSDEITVPFVALAFAQFPLYGIFIGLINKRGNLILGFVRLATIHVVASILCMLLVGENFS
ncbi:MAG: hypothetical protein AAB288_11355 [Acidobacteriota bacterium]